MIEGLYGLSEVGMRVLKIIRIAAMVTLAASARVAAQERPNPVRPEPGHEAHFKIAHDEFDVDSTAHLSMFEEHKLELAVSKYIRQEVIKDPTINFDPQKNGWWKRPSSGRDARHGRAMSQLLNAVIVDADTIVSCTKTSCEMMKPGSLLTIESPKLNAAKDRATVVVHVFRQYVVGPHSLKLADYYLRFQREGESWHHVAGGAFSVN